MTLHKKVLLFAAALGALGPGCGFLVGDEDEELYFLEGNVLASQAFLDANPLPIGFAIGFEHLNVQVATQLCERIGDQDMTTLDYPFVQSVQLTTGTCQSSFDIPAIAYTIDGSCQQGDLVELDLADFDLAAAEIASTTATVSYDCDAGIGELITFTF